MPKPRQAGPAVATNGPTDKKRKREDKVAAETETETASEASPRGNKRTRSIKEEPKSPITSKETARKRSKRVGLQVEAEAAIKVTARATDTLGVKEEARVTIEQVESSPVTKKSPRRKAQDKAAKVLDDVESGQDELEEADTGIPKPKRKRKTKEEKEAEAMPLAARAVGLKMYVGAHTSIAKGVENAITNCVHVGGNAFACFLKSQRKWENPALKDENRDAFRQGLLDHKYDGMAHVVPHGSYLVNLATEDKDKAKQSYDTFIDDLHRCEALGIRYYNFHPGGAGQSSLGDAVTRLANNLNRALSETNTVVPLLENMAGHGTLIGGRFSDLRDVIAQIKPEFRSRIGVCIDTCHAFAAGYDLRTPEAFQNTMDEFDRVVGFRYLKAMHLNDSKAPLASHRDLHQNIGLGFLGLRAFHSVLNEPRFQGLPLILETPCERPDPTDPKGKKTIEDRSVWAREIKLLESLIGMDPASDGFKTLEKDLSLRGKKERDEMQAQFDKKKEKERKKLSKELERGQKSLTDMFGTRAVPKKDVDKDENEGESPLSDLSDLSDDEEEHRC